MTKGFSRLLQKDRFPLDGKPPLFEDLCYIVHADLLIVEDHYQGIDSTVNVKTDNTIYSG